MNFRAIAIVLFLVVVSGGLLVHFRQQSLTDAADVPVKTDGIPIPPKTGPYGKFVVVDKPLHDFGTMEHGQKGSHEFKIRNDGAGPLKLVALARDHTCQCTLGSLGSEGLKPGEETLVTMNWEIKNPSTNFEHSAKIRSDDPENPVVTIRVRGLVGKRLAINSGADMNIGMLSEKKLTERAFVLHSELFDDFEISKLEPSNPLLVVSSRRLTKEELRESLHIDQVEMANEMMQAESKKAASEGKKAASDGKSAGSDGKKAVMIGGPNEHQHDAVEIDDNDGFSTKKPEVKCGHEVKVVFQSGFPIGRFRESLIIHTSIPETPPTVVTFEGTRAGPVQILGTPGISWTPDESILHFPRFRAQEGRTAKLLVFIKKTEVPWEITDAKVSPEFMKYQFIKDENFKGMGRDRFDLLIEIPAGEAPVIFSGDTAGFLILNTTHPEAKVIKLAIDFSSF